MQKIIIFFCLALINVAWADTANYPQQQFTCDGKQNSCQPDNPYFGLSTSYTVLPAGTYTFWKAEAIKSTSSASYKPSYLYKKDGQPATFLLTPYQTIKPDTNSPGNLWQIVNYPTYIDYVCISNDVKKCPFIGAPF